MVRPGSAKAPCDGSIPSPASNLIVAFSFCGVYHLPIDITEIFWHFWTPMKHLLSFSLLAIVALSISACHTVSGVGQDVSEAGHDLSKAANKVERKIQN